MKDINETYKNSGMGEEARNEQIDKDFGDIETGKISEIYAPNTFRGRVRKVASNAKKWGFGGGAATADQNANGGNTGSSGGPSGPSAANASHAKDQSTPASDEPQGRKEKESRRQRRNEKKSQSGKPKTSGYGDQQPPRGNTNPNGRNNPNNNQA